MKTVSKHIFLPLILVLLAAVLTVGISAQELDVGIPVEEYPELFLERTMPTHGEGKIAVFLIQFPDYKNDKPDATAEYYNQLYFSAEPLDANTAGNPWYGSVATFYREQSFGKLNLSGQVFDWYTAKHERAYYNDSWKKSELVMEAVAYYEAKGVDFAQFDGDKNGELDALIYHFAGPADQDMSMPWYDGLEYSANLGKTTGGVEINSFIQIDNKVDKETRNSEKLRQVICHELMHSLGLYDLYMAAWGGFDPVEDLMSADLSFINPYYKILLGWTDKVRLVTTNTLDIQLKLWAESGETILVTDCYNGVFDEFYMIAYTKLNAYAENQIRIWHIDARLTADKTAFLYSNMSYSPKPEMGDYHGHEADFSDYLFMEEVSAIPQYDYVLNRSNNLYFREGSSFGPNSIPNSDTHDGRYTGIRIDDFKRFDTYATMDITFESKDTAAPEVSDELSQLGLSADNKLRFNEYVYPSDNWNKIQITTLIGEPIPTQILRGHYSVHEIEIIIQGDIPQDGYLIVLPEGCVRDSSGNPNKAETIPVVPARYIFEQSRTIIPWYYQEQIRGWGENIFCFLDGNDTVIISAYASAGKWAAFIEFLKIDEDGNIITHSFFPNPREEERHMLHNVFQANDGSYVVQLADYTDKIAPFTLMCIDKNGMLRWQKIPEVLVTGIGLAYENGILFCDSASRTLGKPDYTFLDVQTGSLAVIDAKDPPFFDDACYNGSKIVGAYWHPTVAEFWVRVCDPVTLKVEKFSRLTIDGITDARRIRIAYNSNGTYTVLMEAKDCQGSWKSMAMILDSSFRIMKQVFIDAILMSGRTPAVNLFPNDGFAVAVCTKYGGNTNSTYHIVRMDRNLNLMWEIDVNTDKIAFFITTSNEICAYSSCFSPECEVYLLKYGSEDEFEIISHTLTHHAAQAATCLAEGKIEHWVCVECNGYFADAAGTKAITAAAVILPKAAHVPQAYADVAPTCTAAGSTGGTYCKTCTWELTPKIVIPATGHAPVEDAAVAPTYEREGLTAGSHCGVCNAVITAQQSIPRLEPETTAAPATTAASETTAAPATTAASETTAASATTEAPVTKVPPAWPPAHTVKDKSSSVPEFEDVIPIVIAVVPAAVLVVVLVMILKKRK